MGKAVVLRHDLDGEPEVLALAEATGHDTDWVISKLRRLWRHADIHTDDGVIRYATAQTIDLVCNAPGFALEVCRVGWLVIDLEGARVPKFEKYLGPNGSKRAIGLAPPSRNGKEHWPGFEEFWRRYPRKVAKTEAWRVWDALRPVGEVLAAIHRGLHRDLASEQWRSEKGKYIPYPATWLRGKRWEDEHGGGNADYCVSGRVCATPGKYAKRLRASQTECLSSPQEVLFPEQGAGDSQDASGFAQDD